MIKVMKLITSAAALQLILWVSDSEDDQNVDVKLEEITDCVARESFNFNGPAVSDFDTKNVAVKNSK